MMTPAVSSAPSGWVGDLQLDMGGFAAAGQQIMAFICARDTWIEADMRENNLMHIAPLYFALPDLFDGRVVISRECRFSDYMDGKRGDNFRIS
jgi:hypothetical protein